MAKKYHTRREYRFMDDWSPDNIVAITRGVSRRLKKETREVLIPTVRPARESAPSRPNREGYNRWLSRYGIKE